MTKWRDAGFTMRNEIDTAEKYFADTFIRNSRRERILYELTKTEKRSDCLNRFCHQAKQLLDSSKIVMEGDDMDQSREFTDFVIRHDGLCCVLSPYPFIDGRILPLQDAVDKAVVCPDAAIIVGNTFAILFGEPMKGGRDKYLLSEN